MRYFANRTKRPSFEGFLFLLLLLLSGCSSEPAPVQEEPEPKGPVPDLIVISRSGRMRAAPDPVAAVVRQLPEGARLQDLGEVSTQTTRIRYGEEAFDAPWLQVRDSTGGTGWIYAREVAPFGNSTPVSEFRQQKLLQSLIGKSGRQQLQEYQSTWREADSEAAVARLYRRGLDLRDTLAPLLEEKSYDYNGESLPDLFWLGDHLPGYVPQLVAEGTVYYLFNDYEQWLGLARNSRGEQDDHFFSLMTQCFPEDSVEYFYPAWELQTWDYGGHNLLGRGMTYEILARIEQISAQTPLFQEALTQLKDRIVSDITRADLHFWEPDSLVKQELDTIIKANWSIFTVTDEIALSTRRLQLDSAAVYGIRFNARAGE